MRHCPSCFSQYSDQTLNFCLQDGTPLVGEVRQSAIDTVAFGRPVTAEKISPTTDFADLKPEIGRRPENHYAPQLSAPRPQRSRSFLKVGLVVLPLVLVVAASGLAGWLYFSSQKQVLANGKNENSQVFDSPANAIQRPLDAITHDRTSTGSLNQTSAAKVNVEGIRRDIANIVNSWKSAVETCNTADYAAKYGEKVEYLDRHGVTASEVAGDMHKTCNAYSKIEIYVDNMVVAVDAEGDAATAIFDKEWRYEASPKLSQGKAHVKLHFRKVGDQWKIVSEQNLKTYYTKN